MHSKNNNTIVSAFKQQDAPHYCKIQWQKKWENILLVTYKEKTTSNNHHWNRQRVMEMEKEAEKMYLTTSIGYQMSV